MNWTTPLAARLGLRYPLFQAPMAGGPTTPALVAAVSAAGGLGSLAVGYQTPDQIREDVRAVRRLTDRPFAANMLLAGDGAADASAIARAQAWLRPVRDRLGLPTPVDPARFAEAIEAQAAVLLDEGVGIVSFAFGLPAPALLEAFRARGVFVIGTATTVAEGRAWAEAGADAVIAQGFEAGGHRGTFLAPFESSLVGTAALVPQLVDALALPVVAAGGLMDGRGLLAALALGAEAAQFGTAFLLADESGTHVCHRRAIAASSDTATVLTRSFSGKPVRALENGFIRAMRPHELDWPPYPVQNVLTRDIRRAGAEQADPDALGMWAGQAAPLARSGPAAGLMAGWIAQAEAIATRLNGGHSSSTRAV